MEEKAANHDAMMKRFNLRKMSSNGIQFFGRASELLIDKAIGGQLHRGHRFSLHRQLQKMTSVKARKRAFQRLTSPITPKSWVSTCHGLLMLLIYHLQLLYLPFCVSYFPGGSFGTAIIAMLLEMMFMLDILVRFNTAYVEHGVLVTSRRRIAQRYIRSWFAFDLLSAVPMQFLYYFLMENYTNDALRGVQTTLMVLRLLRVSFFERSVLVGRIVQVANRFVEWARYSRYSHLLRIALLMWLVLLFAHYMACMWHVVSCKHQRQAQVVGEQYIADYYYAVSLIQGQGIAGGTWEENLYSSAAIIVGSVILAIVFGNVAMLVSNFNASTTNYYRKMEAVYETMEKMDLPLRLRNRVNEYYKHVWVEYESLDGNINQFQKELTHTLGVEIGLYKHMHLVIQVPFWKDCTPDFLTQIVQNLDVRVYMPDDYVVRRRETGSEMLMLNRGYCKLSKPAKVDNNLAGSSTHLPVLMTQINQVVGIDSYKASDSEGDDTNDWSSDDEELANFGGGLFGDSMNSLLSGSPTHLGNDRPSGFTDVRRFQSGRTRRPSCPEGTESKKSKKYREYLHPGQAFGEMSLLMNYKRTANIRAITFVEMCVLSRKNFQHIISRYPVDRRRVLTSMLESCIEKKVIPFPWESIVQAAAAKRRNDGKKDFSRASVIATMTAKEAAQILVEAIDINAPDESIKYGFQSFDQEFIDDSSLRHANSTDAKISDTLQRRSGSPRRLRSYSTRNLMTDGSGRSTATSDFTDVESKPASASGSSQSDKTLQSLLLLVQSMAGNIERLQQDVSDLKNQQQKLLHCCCGGSGRDHRHPGDSEKVPSNTREVEKVHQALEHQNYDPLVVVPQSFELLSDKNRTNSRTGSRKKPRAILRKVRSTMQESRAVNSPHNYSGRMADRFFDTDMGIIDTEDADRYHVNLSSRSRAARTRTLTDMLWKRSNTKGDLLKHTEEERNAARLKRQLQTRPSLPSEMEKTPIQADKKVSSQAENVHDPNADFISHGDVEESSPTALGWLPKTGTLKSDIES